MKAHLQILRQQHWDKRLLHERRAIIFGAAIVLPLLIYFLFWQPSHEAVRKLREQLPQLRIHADQMQKTSGQIEALRHRPQLAVMDARAVQSAIETAASTHQLSASLTSITAQEPNGVRITMAAISFEKLLIWLRELQTSQHIRVDSISVTKLSDPGMVAVRATLTNGGAP